jgi:hypothetical protein
VRERKRKAERGKEGDKDRKRERGGRENIREREIQKET